MIQFRPLSVIHKKRVSARAKTETLLHLEFSSNVATAIGGDGGGVKLVIWISELRRESACRKGHAMREAARRYSMIRFTLLGMTQILSTTLGSDTRTSGCLGAWLILHFTIRMGIQDADLPNLSDERKLQSVVALPTRWH